MHVQLSRKPSLGGQIGKTRKAEVDPSGLSLSQMKTAGLPPVLRPSFDLEGVIAGRKMKIRGPWAHEMIRPARQLLRIAGLSQMVLQMDTARERVLVLADNRESHAAVTGPSNACR
jgi:hypothetical protein